MSEQNESGKVNGETPADRQGVVEPESPGLQPSWRPADYYAEPPARARFPRWVPLSCGAAALVALVLMFAVGLFFRNGGLSSFVALAIGQFQGELKSLVVEDVTPESRKVLDDSLREVRRRLTEGEIQQGAVLPLLEKIREVSSDGKVTPDEIEGLQKVVDEIAPTKDRTDSPVEL